MPGRVIRFGFADNGYNDLAKRRGVDWCEDFATNAHMLVAGKSGTGKTFTLRRIVNQVIAPIAGKEPVRVHVFDVHGDMRFDQESRVLFSESTFYGINPFRLSADPHFGGVRKCVQSFIEMMGDSGPRAALGPRQTTALRNVLYELFESKGFHVNDPSTWSIDAELDEEPDGQGRIYLEVPYDERDAAKAAARAASANLKFDPDRRLWWCDQYAGGLERWPIHTRGRKAPTVPEAARFLSQRLKTLVTGGGTRTVQLLEEHNKKVQVWQNKARKLIDGAPKDDLEALQAEVHDGAAALIETFTDYVTSIGTGRELDALARYESTDTLKSLADRLDTMVATGIFRPRQPPFDPHAPVHTYDIAPLRVAEQQFFVWTKVKQILEDLMAQGPVAGASEVRTMIVLDESEKFFKDKEDNIIDRAVKEGRKFGLSIVAASQAPSHFSEDFLGNVGTKLLLGLDPMYRDVTARKMRIDPTILDYVVASKIAAVSVSDKRDMAHGFVKTRVGN